MNYVKVINNKVVEIKRKRFNQPNFKPNEPDWLPLLKEQIDYNPDTHFLTHSHFEIFEDKVVEHFNLTEINFTQAEEETEPEIEE